jgi:hypothetical protein
VYQWVVKLNGILHNSSSTYSTSDTSFRVAPYWLLVNTVYTIEYIALSTVTGRASIGSVNVFVAASNVVALVEGGTDQTTYVGQYKSLDASSSFDEDQDPSMYANTLAGLMFGWSCETIYPVPSLDCSYRIISAGKRGLDEHHLGVHFDCV